MWHASVALFADGRPVPTSELSPWHRKAAQAIARGLIAGVGDQSVTREERKGVAHHARRALTPAEIAGLDPAWVALPAIDEG